VDFTFGKSGGVRQRRLKHKGRGHISGFKGKCVEALLFDETIGAALSFEIDPVAQGSVQLNGVFLDFKGKQFDNNLVTLRGSDLQM
jgi:hypothetical protein